MKTYESSANFPASNITIKAIDESSCPVHWIDDMLDRRCHCLKEMKARLREINKSKRETQDGESQSFSYAIEEIESTIQPVESHSSSIEIEEEVCSHECSTKHPTCTDSCVSHYKPHRCSMKVEPTTSCESHYMEDRRSSGSTNTTKTKYEADDEKSFETLKTSKGSSHKQRRPYREIEEHSSSASRPLTSHAKVRKGKSNETTNQDIGERSLERMSIKKESAESLPQHTQSNMIESASQTGISPSSSEEYVSGSSKPSMNVESYESRKASKKSLSRVESHSTHVPHDHGSSHVCSCAKKHPKLFESIHKAK